MTPTDTLARPAARWSTQQVPVAEQFAYWRDVVWEAFVPVSPSLPGKPPAYAGDGSFTGSVAAAAVGALGVSHIVSQAQAVTRTEAQVRRDPGDVYFLNLPLVDGTRASQSGRTATLRAGDFTIVDSAQPFELGFGGAFDQLSVTLPHAMLAPLLADPAGATAVRVRGDRGVGAVASSALRALATQAGVIDRAAARAVGSHVAGLVALAIGGSDRTARPTDRTLLLQAALDELDRSLGDPELTPAHVADRLGVSVRSLHRLFADSGRTFGRTLLQRRLERCSEDLADPELAHWTITQVATEHGFVDPSYFARAFRSRYGVPPSNARRGGA
ncbi:MAG: helix-turn-helix domain-containing protein [Solirubrobacteraceae bacterium]|nr:helix-turn-helix domain-containing protein [Patulibacter sp.]